VIRRNPITSEPVVFAPQRADRPHAFIDERTGTAHCPFCPGNERDTPPELARLGARDEPWRARVFPNKYPPLEGAEVIVESPDHDATFDRIEHAREVVRLYADRYHAHGDAAYVSLFRNHGTRAGASIPHLHSQLVPASFLPPRVEKEVAGFRAATHCPLCAMREHVIDETPHFTWLAPEASSMPYQQWLVPKRHVSAFTDLHDEELDGLASLLQASSRAMLAIADAYNWAFMSFPREPAAHFYVDLFPRMTVLAGFELGTGTFVEIIDPATAATRLRT
jgi:UDPglucose--hexose-1-phosphate uridylyltransferase